MARLPSDAKQRENYGRGEHTIDPSEYLDTDELIERLRTTFRAPGYRPPVLPASALELVRLSNKPGVSFKEVESVLERDTMITGRVLQVAQSPIYNVRGGALTLQQAMVRLGLTTLTQIFLEVSTTMRIFRAPGYDAPMNMLRRHATATAHIARVVCRHVAFGDEYAFLCALLHDCGIAAALMVLGEAKRGVAATPFADVYPAVMQIHEEVGGMLCQVWKLPPDVELVVRNHHSCTVSGQVHPLTAAIVVAEAIATQLGFGMEYDSQPEVPEVAVTALKLTDRTLAQIRTEALVAVQRVQ